MADIACVLLRDTGSGLESETIELVQGALVDAGLRMELRHAPSNEADEKALPLKLKSGTAWLYVRRQGEWERSDAERIAARLTDLLTQAQERAAHSDTAAGAEAERRTEVAKSAILHAISHDLSSPLTAITTAASELARPGLSEDERIRLSRAVADEAERLSSIAADMADLSRIGAGACNPQAEPCDLSDTIARAADSVRVRRDGHEIRVALPPDLPRVHADRAQLERVFDNLIDNAIKFSPPGAPVEVRGACGNGRITIRVVDQGRGIPAGRRNDIFEPFVRGGSPEPSSGLGLAICRGFVEANGGRVTLQSGARDGSAFAVSFPLAEQPESAAQRA